MGVVEIDVHGWRGTGGGGGGLENSISYFVSYFAIKLGMQEIRKLNRLKTIVCFLYT